MTRGAATGIKCLCLGVGLAACITVACASSAYAQVEFGVAAAFPRDVGLSSHPSVIFTEGFEQGSIGALTSAWDSSQHAENMSFSADVPAESAGAQSLYISGGWADLYRQLLPGYEQLYARVYAKLDPSCTDVHHWIWLGGHNPPTAWPWPRAGSRPAGDERWSTGVEPQWRYGSPEWRWAFYTYWMDMRLDADGNYWGNTFESDPAVPSDRGEWLSVEFMVKMNSPASASNGEQAFWINGVRGSHYGPGFPTGTWWGNNVYGPDGAGTPFPGYRWRNTASLNVNYFWLEHFVDYDAGCEAWFDDLVIATEYIGPMVTGAMSIDGGVGTDAGVTPVDSGPTPDGGGVTPMDGGSSRTDGGPVVTDEISGGCSCALAGRGGGHGGFAVLLGCALIAALRVRRRGR